MTSTPQTTSTLEQKPVGTLPADQAKILLFQQTKTRRDLFLITIGATIGLAIMFVVIIYQKQSMLMTFVLMFFLVTFLTDAILLALMLPYIQRIRKIKAGPLPVYSSTGKFSFTFVRSGNIVAGGNSVSASPAADLFTIYLDGNRLPASMNGSSIYKLKDMIAAGTFNPEKVTIRYIPALKVNWDVRDDQGRGIDSILEDNVAYGITKRANIER